MVLSGTEDVLPGIANDAGRGQPLLATQVFVAERNGIQEEHRQQTGNMHTICAGGIACPIADGVEVGSSWVWLRMNRSSGQPVAFAEHLLPS